jgi:hypothetical protein
MQTIQILTSEGKKENVNVHPIDENTYQFVEASNSSYCLTCGYVPEQMDEIKILNVVSQEGLRDMLNDREHFSNHPSDHVALCGNCIEELIF